VTSSVVLSWTLPDTRENGDALELYEIGGYEILYRKVGEELFTSDLVNDSQMSEYTVDDLEPGDYEFMMATVDSDGLYSEYVTVHITL